MRTMATMKENRNITDFFPTISASKRKRTPAVAKSKRLLSDVGCSPKSSGKVVWSKDSRTTPKRRIVRRDSDDDDDGVRSSSTKKPKTAATDLVLRAGCRPHDLLKDAGGAVRKLQFDDIGGDQNECSFADFVRSKKGAVVGEQKTADQKSADDKPLISAEEIKEKLKGCRNLSKLKERLATINGCAEKVRQFKDMKIVMSPVKKTAASGCGGSNTAKSSPRKTLFGTPLKSSPGRRNQIHMTDRSPIKPRMLFASPAKPTKKRADDENDDDLTGLALPVKFQRLLELFKLIDYHCWRMYKRQEVCTFDKLKQVVEDATRRTFTLDAFLKLLTVDREQPKFRLSYETYGGELKLVVTPVYPQETIKCLNSVGSLLERERIFHRSLLERTKVEHLKFLGQMNLTLDEQDRLFRWHPMFPLETVPDIKPCYSLLPAGGTAAAAKKTAPKPTTILDYFQKKTVQDDVKKPEMEPKNSPSKVESGLLKGVPLDLLAKVRAKEAAKLALAMKRPPEIDQEIRTLGKMPQICRIVYDCFLGSQAGRPLPSIAMNDLTERVANSVPMSVREARRHLEYLAAFPVDCNTGAKWLQLVQAGGGQQPRYAKINTSYTLANLFSAFRTRMQNLQQ